MGGTIFTKQQGDQHALSCPRMRPAIYIDTRERCAAVLRRYFAHVATPPEAPGKRDFGDVDFHVFASIDGTPVGPAEFKQLLPKIKDALGAARMQASGAELVSYAVPLVRTTADDKCDTDEAGPTATSTTVADIDNGPSKRRRLSPDGATEQHYAQVDVTLCATLADFHWTSWQHAYGDVTQILAISLRPLGLIFTPHGFVMRDPDIERLDLHTPVGPAPSKKSMADINLSNDPDAVMRFLGLNVRWYEAGFETEDHLFDWLSECRFISREVYGRYGEGYANDEGYDDRLAPLHDTEKPSVPTPADAETSTAQDGTVNSPAPVSKPTDSASADSIADQPTSPHDTETDKQPISTPIDANSPLVPAENTPTPPAHITIPANARNPAPQADTTRTNATQPPTESASASASARAPTAAKHGARARAHDRRRRHTRPMLSRYIEHYLPAHPSVGLASPTPTLTPAPAPAPGSTPDGAAVTARAADVLADAACTFCKEDERAARRADVRGAQGEAAFWNAVRARIPRSSGSAGREAVRALRRWVRFEGPAGGARPVIGEEAVLEEEGGHVPRWTEVCGFRLEELLAWVQGHWEVAKGLERERVRAEGEARRAAKAVGGHAAGGA